MLLSQDVVCASGASFRTDTGCLASERQKEARSFKDGRQAAGMPWRVWRYRVSTRLPISRGLAVDLRAPQWSELAPACPSDMKESILELLAFNHFDGSEAQKAFGQAMQRCPRLS